MLGKISVIGLGPGDENISYLSQLRKLKMQTI